MSAKNTPEESLEAKTRQKERNSVRKIKIKERIKLSNESEKAGGNPDPWVVNYRIRNNEIKAKWKAKQPKKEFIRKPNSGSFKKGRKANIVHTDEQRQLSLLRWRENTKKWLKNNKERVNELARNRRENPSIRIKCNLRKRLSYLLKKSIVSKTEQTLDLLGISIEEFKIYLQSKFQEGMTFDNYGKWHLDHIKPCFLFDLTKIEDRKECFHFTNIQPLWAYDNLVKNKKYQLVKDL